jgi:hypothetical protein
MLKKIQTVKILEIDAVLIESVEHENLAVAGEFFGPNQDDTK